MRRLILFAVVGALMAGAPALIRAQQVKTDPLKINLSPEAARKALADMVTIQGKYVTLTILPYRAKVSPGRLFVLMVTVEPGPKMHLYAPDQKGYIPVALDLESSPAYRPVRVIYPKPTWYEFAPLQERVQVYDRPFTLSRMTALASTPDILKRATARETLTIHGTFSYQACDDQVCYRPETLPLEWKVPLVAR